MADPVTRGGIALSIFLGVVAAWTVPAFLWVVPSHWLSLYAGGGPSGASDGIVFLALVGVAILGTALLVYGIFHADEKIVPPGFTPLSWASIRFRKVFLNWLTDGLEPRKLPTQPKDPAP